MQHELEVASFAGALGSIDANTGDVMLGWDTDQFPTDIYLTPSACFRSSTTVVSSQVGSISMPR